MGFSCFLALVIESTGEIHGKNMTMGQFLVCHMTTSHVFSLLISAFVCNRAFDSWFIGPTLQILKSDCFHAKEFQVALLSIFIRISVF